METVTNADAAVRVAADQAILASQQGTFAVGGAIINNETGAVICALHNNVLKPVSSGTTYFMPYDPTAHGERQLVDWYYTNRSPLNLPSPEKLTIVTTLDPCAMCTGALLTAGFNVGVSALDDFAGINYNGKFDFPSLPEWLRHKIQASFGYYAVDRPISRTYQGSQNVAFFHGAVSAQTYSLTDNIFGATVESVRNKSNAGSLDPTKMTNPRDLPDDSPVKKAFRKVYAEAFQINCPNYRLPNQNIAVPLLNAATAAESRGASRNAVALLDYFGNLLLCLGGYEHLSPIRTAFMETTRAYANLRWNLINDPDSKVREEAQSTLTHPKYGTFVFLYAPDPNKSEALMTFGAYGSTMEGAVPHTFPSNLQYVLLPTGVSEEDVAQMALRLPPLYTDLIQVAPIRVLNQELIQTVSK